MQGLIQGRRAGHGLLEAMLLVGNVFDRGLPEPRIDIHGVLIFTRGRLWRRVGEVWVLAGFDGFCYPNGVILRELDLSRDLTIQGRPYLQELQEGSCGQKRIGSLPEAMIVSQRTAR